MSTSVRRMDTYSYEGPLPLGSVLSHVCGAVGLFTTREKPFLRLTATEEQGQYTVVAVLADGDVPHTLGIWEAPATSEGRSALGRKLLAILREALGQVPSPWGSLVGVRPTKLYHQLWDRGLTKTACADYLIKERQVSREKVALLTQIASLQRPILEAGASDRHISVYGGIPFCPSHCSYCSFPFAMIHQYPRVDAFIKAFVHDCQAAENIMDRYQLIPSSLYMGGGTPTSLNDEEFAVAVRALSRLGKGAAEFTVEAGRPDTVTKEKLLVMQTVGTNRISINPQTMQDAIVKRIGRGHSVADILSLYERVRQETDFTVNMDFIVGLPTQTMAHIVENLDYVCQMGPENVTIHTLALKRGSPMYEQKDQLPLPDRDTVEAMVAYCAERLQAAGYVPYYLYRQQYMGGAFENVGYTKPGHACLYNIHMMEERQPILSVGPGSTSKCMRAPTYRQGKHYMPKDVDTYIRDQERLCAKRRTLWAQFYGED